MLSVLHLFWGGGGPNSLVLAYSVSNEGGYSLLIALKRVQGFQEGWIKPPLNQSPLNRLPLYKGMRHVCGKSVRTDTPQCRT